MLNLIAIWKISRVFKKIPANLVLKFVERFARLECTMKMLPRYCKVNDRRNGLAEPNWNALYQDAGPVLASSKNDQVVESIKYLLENPPEIQIVENNVAVFRPQQLFGESIGEQALRAVSRVRNNLFHGGKHTGHSPEERDEKLLSHSITLIEATANIDLEFKAIFLDIA